MSPRRSQIDNSFKLEENWVVFVEELLVLFDRRSMRESLNDVTDMLKVLLWEKKKHLRFQTDWKL